MNTPALGGYPSHTDYRDAIAGLSATAPAVSGVCHTDLGSVLDQNHIPACVSHSVTYLIRLWWFRTHGEWVDFSPRFLDILSDETWIPADGGRVPRTVLKVALKQGICTTATLPNDTSLSIADYRNPAAITAQARAEALKYRIPGFIRIGTAPDTTRQGIHLYGALSSLYMVGSELWTPSWDEADLSPLRTPQHVVSGHQMTPCGVKATGLTTLRNQWSAKWARNGEADYSPDAWNAYTNEQWAIAEIPADTAAFLHSLPSPTAFTYAWNQNLSQGQMGDDIKFLQIAYMILGYLPPVAPDELGFFGPKTAAANARFQATHNIPSSPSNVGPLTRAALNKQFSV